VASCHQTFKKYEGEHKVRKSLVNLADFLSIIPNKTKFLPSAGLFCYICSNLSGVCKQVENIRYLQKNFINPLTYGGTHREICGNRQGIGVRVNRRKM
jgi:hypothetical protein